MFSNSNRRFAPIKSELSDTEIQFIMANTDFDKQRILAFYSDFQRKCPSNKIDRKNFINFYKALIPGKFLQYIYIITSG